MVTWLEWLETDVATGTRQTELGKISLFYIELALATYHNLSFILYKNIHILCIHLKNFVLNAAHTYK